MQTGNLQSELERFNALEEVRAKAILVCVDGQKPVFRSCWYCNGAHERLKNLDLFLCFACGIYYCFGYPAPIVAIRSKGIMVTQEDMLKFKATLDRAL